MPLYIISYYSYYICLYDISNGHTSVTKYEYEYEYKHFSGLIRAFFVG